MTEAPVNVRWQHAHELLKSTLVFEAANKRHAENLFPPGVIKEKGRSPRYWGIPHQGGRGA